LEQEISEHQELINALHGLSLVTGDRRADKLKELKARYAGTQIELLLTRLFA
jgi:serine/threonine protein phosphatase 1